jgi:hypothetical protein
MMLEMGVYLKSLGLTMATNWPFAIQTVRLLSSQNKHELVGGFIQRLPRPRPRPRPRMGGPA